MGLCLRTPIPTHIPGLAEPTGIGARIALPFFENCYCTEVLSLPHGLRIARKEPVPPARFHLVFIVLREEIVLFSQILKFRVEQIAFFSPLFNIGSHSF